VQDNVAACSKCLLMWRWHSNFLFLSVLKAGGHRTSPYVSAVACGAGFKTRPVLAPARVFDGITRFVAQFLEGWRVMVFGCPRDLGPKPVLTILVRAGNLIHVVFRRHCRDSPSDDSSSRPVGFQPVFR